MLPLLSKICKELEIYFEKLYILNTKLVPVARASPKAHTIQTLRLYPYSLHMYMK